MTIPYSIVIPASNRAHQLRLTLAAFENQTLPANRFEVVVVNDGSTDDTESFLRRYRRNAPYRLIVVTLAKQSGRSSARNEGARRSSGRNIIFCDADFLVLPHFLEVFDRYYSLYDNTIFSGVPESWVGAYTHYYPEFPDAEKQNMKTILGPHGLWKDRFHYAAEIASVFTPEDVIRHPEKLKQAIAWYMNADVRAECRRTDVAPWLLFITRCVSVARSDFEQAGGFYEGFVKYGLEDWELGYRLHKRGLSFMSIDELLGYHQEHPIAYRGEDGNEENLRKIYEMHGASDPELAVMSGCPPWTDYSKYKNSLRKIKSSLQPQAEQTAPPLLPHEMKGPVTLAANEPLQLPAPQFDAARCVPLYTFPACPAFDDAKFSRSAVPSENGVTGCMWLDEAPYGNWGEPNGLLLFRASFVLAEAAVIRLDVPYADDAAVVYMDDKAAAMNAVVLFGSVFAPKRMPALGNGYRALLPAGTHTVLAAAINACSSPAHNRAGLSVSVVNEHTGATLLSSANPSAWSSTGYITSLPRMRFALPGAYTVYEEILNFSTYQVYRSGEWTVRVE